LTLPRSRHASKWPGGAGGCFPVLRQNTPFFLPGGCCLCIKAPGFPSRVQFSPGIARHHPLLRPVSPRNVRLSSESPGFPSAAPVFSQKTPWNSPRGGCLLLPSRFRRQFFCVHGFVFFNLARILQYTTCTELKSSGLQQTAGALHKRYYHNWRYIL